MQSTSDSSASTLNVYRPMWLTPVPTTRLVDKSLKARLTEAGLTFPRTHELSII
jgi:hypothetical protein